MTPRNYLSISLSALLISGFSVLHAYAQPRPLDPKPPKDSLHPLPGPKLHAQIKHIHLGDTLELVIKAPATQAFTLHILTHQDSLLYTVAVDGGTTLLPTFPIGHYHYEVLGDSGKVVAKGKFHIHTPKPLVVPKPKDTLRSVPRPKLHVDLKSIEVGDTLKLRIKASDTLAFTLRILNHKDSLLYIVAVKGGKNFLPTYPIGHYHYEVLGDSGKVVAKGKFNIRAPRPTPFEARILLGDSLKVWIGVPSTESFTLNILTHGDSLLVSVPVTGGTNLLPVLAEGHYHFEIIGDSGVVLKKGKFDIRAPKLKPFEARILLGDSLKLWIGVPATQTFTLNILTHGDSLITSVAVTGGVNVLPALPIGHYHYEIVGDSGSVLKKGKFDVRPLKLKSEIAPNPSFSGLGTITVDAPITEVFTLHIFSAATPLKSVTINGGATLLPAIPAGVYHYHVVNSSGYVVSRGRILILD